MMGDKPEEVEYVTSWCFFWAVLRRSLRHAFEIGHRTHTSIVLAAGALATVALLVGWPFHLEESKVIAALPFLAVVTYFLIGLFREAFSVYRDEHQKRVGETAALRTQLQQEQRQWAEERAALESQVAAARAALESQVAAARAARDVREHLGQLLTEGNEIMATCGNQSQPPPEEQASQWQDRVEAVLGNSLGNDYIHRFRNSAGLPLAATSISSKPHRNLWGALRNRLARLEQFLEELGRG